jgi:hypothetical protein
MRLVSIRPVAAWLLASFASVVAGVSGLLAVIALIVARSQGGRALTIGCVLAAVAVAALIGGRKARPKAVRSLPAVRLSEGDDYSGLPASPGFAANPLPIALAGLALALTAVLFPVGFLMTVGAAWVGSEVGILMGVGIAALGPVMLATSLVLRR